MTCPTHEELLNFIHGDIGSTETIVPAHVKTCSRCRKEYDQVMALSEVLSRTSMGAAPGTHLSMEEAVGYVGQNLDGDLNQKTEEHLSLCGPCLEEVSSVNEALDEFPASVPREVEQRVMALVRSSKRSTRRMSSSRRTRRVRALAQRRSPSLLSFAAAAAVLLVGITLFLTFAVKEDGPLNSGGAVAKEAKPSQEPVAGLDPKIPPLPDTPKDKGEASRRERSAPRPELARDPAPKADPMRNPEEKSSQDATRPPSLVRQPEMPETVTGPSLVAVSVHKLAGDLFRENGRVNSGDVFNRDEVAFTSHRNFAAFSIAEGRLILRKNTKLTFSKERDGRMAIRLLQGEAFFSIEKKGREFMVSTSAANAVVTGTSFLVRKEEKTTVLTVLEGSVTFRTPRAEVRVGKHQQSRASEGGHPSRPRRLTSPETLVAWTQRPDLAGNGSRKEYLEVQSGTNRKLRGLVMVAPYSEWETQVASLAGQVSSRLDVGLVRGHFYREKSNKKMWVNLDRGTEAEVFSEGKLGEPEETHRSRRMFKDYRESLAEATGLSPKVPVEFLFNLRHHYDQDAEKKWINVCEVAHKGFSRRTLQEAKRLVEKRIQELAPRQKVEFQFDELDNQYAYQGTTRELRFTERDAKRVGYLTPKVARRGLTLFLPPVPAEDVETYATIVEELAQFLYVRH